LALYLASMQDGNQSWWNRLVTSTHITRISEKTFLYYLTSIKGLSRTVLWVAFSVYQTEPEGWRTCCAGANEMLWNWWRCR
jgi:hypothetical protein